MRLRERLEVTPEQYVYIAWAAMILLAVIVLTGAAVRLTDSGLGCPTWPRCSGKVYPPDQTHALIEFSNRVTSSLVGLAVAFVAIFALTRRPFRRDLAILAWLLPLGVVAQAVLGGFTVRYDLAPGLRDGALQPVDGDPDRGGRARLARQLRRHAAARATGRWSCG